MPRRVFSYPVLALERPYMDWNGALPISRVDGLLKRPVIVACGLFGLAGLLLDGETALILW
jgi:hypothetical protein